ncbi:phosphotransferase family protein [Streptomyces sedi]|uniref:Aminoglycoside phosphotransferase family protein n=1 Tax=Streptomyces sedi TaxID=555059 RepID=A0A5C4V1A8_9ACTN|nr:aminoglycoside phosphotransferase family protein [Streptomyces sedi]TNM29771.1 aminoglycoside phosphotransferase family protein [Streptomyces sedi]
MCAPGQQEDATAEWDAARAWVEETLGRRGRVTRVDPLRGGWTSRMRRLVVSDADGTRTVVLRSLVRPFFARHAEGLLTREARTLRLLAGTDVPAPLSLGFDAGAARCVHPSSLMTWLPGRLRLEQAGHGRRVPALARELARLHAVRVPEERRPRVYQAWTSAERVVAPTTGRPDLWARAVAAIRREPPGYRGRLLHRDFHPGNVLFAGEGAALSVSGVVDWVETSWGPADLDVAHCATALALLHGPDTGMRFADAYVSAGGELEREPGAHLYWRLLDALAYAPYAEKVAGPWRECGRNDLTPGVLAARLEDYLGLLLRRYG